VSCFDQTAARNVASLKACPTGTELEPRTGNSPAFRCGDFSVRVGQLKPFESRSIPPELISESDHVRNADCSSTTPIQGRTD
jgi:hypothetical protein